MLKIYNTLSKQKEAFHPIDPDKVGMYVCGMTVYDFCHMGHARVLVMFDVITRHLRRHFPKVEYVRNITDIDDKIIQRANENGENFKVLNGVKFDESLAAEYILELQEIERLNGNFTDVEVKVSSLSGSESGSKKLPRFHYSTKVRMVQQVPEAPLHDRIDMSNSHNLPGSTFYQDGTLFHGPKFQGIEQVLNIGEQGLTLECRLPDVSAAEQGQFVTSDFNPFAADLAFQAMLIWAWRFHQSGSLPLKTDLLEHFRNVEPATRFFLSMSVNKSSASTLNANLFLHDEQGLLYTRMWGAEVTLSKSLNTLFGKKNNTAGKSMIKN